MNKESLENIKLTWHNEDKRSQGKWRVTSVRVGEMGDRTETGKDDKVLKIPWSNERQNVVESHERLILKRLST